jgi:hypothetical protein
MSTHELSGHPFVRLVVAHLDHENPDIPGPAARWIEDHRDEALPLLLSLVEDRTLLPDDSLAGGFLPAVAAYLLGDLGDPDAVEPLLSILSGMPHVRPEIDQWDCIWDALHEMQDCVTEPALRFYESATTARARVVAATILGDVQSDDPRVLDVLVAELPNHPCLLSVYLARLGDPGALPVLLETFNHTEHYHSGDLGDAFIGQPLLDLHDAIDELAGELTPAQTRTYERAWMARHHTPPPRAWSTGRGRHAPPVPITAATFPEFCRNAILTYTTMNRASEKVGMRPAELWHYAYTRYRALHVGASLRRPWHMEPQYR